MPDSLRTYFCSRQAYKAYLRFQNRAAQDYPLSNERLKELAAKYGAPADYFVSERALHEYEGRMCGSTRRDCQHDTGHSRSMDAIGRTTGEERQKEVAPAGAPFPGPHPADAHWRTDQADFADGFPPAEAGSAGVAGEPADGR